LTLQDFRDIAIVILALFGLVALGLMVVVTLVVYKKVAPLIDNARQVLDTAHAAMNNVQGTAVFLSETAVSPLIRGLSFVSGIKAAGGRLAGLAKKKEATHE